MIGLTLAVFLPGGMGVIKSAPPETLDRVVASIGNLAITRSDVEAEYRFELFLEGKPPATPPDEAALTRVRDRLLEQKLLDEGAAQTDPADNAIDPLAGIRKRFGSEEAFQSARLALGMDDQQIMARIAFQKRMLRLVDQRFRPAAWPERAEIEAYYRDEFVPDFTRKRRDPAPPLDEVENQIRDILIERNINRLLGSWLEEMKSSRRVRIHDF